MTRIADKIKEIREYLDQLKDIIPGNIAEYKGSLEKKAACERYVEKIVEAVTDLAFLTIKIKKLKIPEDDNSAFTILCESNIISDALATRLRNAKGMKNILAHQYGKIDDEIVFEAVTQELEKDVEAFIKQIEKVLK
ncbi:MAG TPA: DUF86 domain-containing protein [Candidatus Nanoarchaeia archaeon]|nr:DUF86 domain-containing protein [Candidatus Nanoarchaeia archaeon]